MNVFDNRRTSTEQLPKLNTKAKLEIDPDLCSISSDYDMLSDLFNFKVLMDSPNFGIKRYKNATYKG